jgi:hypothetical protein
MMSRAPDGQVVATAAVMFLGERAPRMPFPAFTQNPMRAEINLFNQIKSIGPVQPSLEKYFRFAELQSPLYSPPSRPTKGAYHDRRDTRGGERWTRQRQARQ